MDLRILTGAALIALGSIRALELWLNHRHVQLLKEVGGRYHGRAGLGIIVAGQVLLFAGMIVEGIWSPPHPTTQWWTSVAVAFAVLAILLRYWCIATLGRRWTMAVYTLDEPLVARGPYRFLRHPNYAAVMLELIAFCVSLQLWITLIAAGSVTAVGLGLRIHWENLALAPLRKPRMPRQTS